MRTVVRRQSSAFSRPAWSSTNAPRPVRRAIAGESTAPTASRFVHDFSRIPAQSPATEPSQTSLTINQPGDAAEQAADRVADRVTGMAEPALQAFDAVRPPIRSGSADGRAAPSSVQDVVHTPGRPLDPAVQRSMESRFDHDFSHVRIHAGADAAVAAQAIDARAYTVGRHIVFDADQYAPGASDGQRLLAHELAHVVQQGTTGWSRSGQASPQVMRKPRDEAPPVDLNTAPASWFYADDPIGHVASIYFDTASAAVDKDDQDQLNQVQQLLTGANPPTAVTVEGYADSDGSADANQELSARRAEAAAAWLRLPSPAPSVSAIGRGEQGPEPTGRNATELSHYRRVDVIIEPPRQTTRPTPPEEQHAQARSVKLNRALSRASDALGDTLAALAQGQASAALEQYFPHERYRSAAFERILAAEIAHMQTHIASIHYQEFKTVAKAANPCDGNHADYNEALCSVLTHDVASAFPLDTPTEIVLTPAWYQQPPSFPASLLVHEAAHLLLGHRGHPTEAPHRDPYAIQGFVAALGGLGAEESNRRYPARR